MICIPAIHQKLSQRVAQPISRQITRRVSQRQFLIVCCGNELQGDAAVGPLVAMTISGWNTASVRAVTVDALSPKLASEIAKASYVIFVEPCRAGNLTCTAQLSPVVFDKHQRSEAIHLGANQCSARDLLNLTQQSYGDCPQSWLLEVPTADFRFARRISSTAKTGINQALKIITQFMRTYQSPYTQPQDSRG